MPATYEQISSTVLSSTQTSINFTSIADTWTDLRLVFKFSTSATGDCNIRLNGDTGNNYSSLVANFDGAAPNAICAIGTSMPGNVGGNTGTSTRVNLFTWDIMNYKSTNTWKSILCTWQQQINNVGSSQTGFGSGIWRDNAAVTSISIQGGSYIAGSIVSLFGIKGA